MSYYGRRWYRRSNRSRTFRNSSDSTPSHEKSLAFVRSEFFGLDEHSFERLAKFYGRQYGASAQQYLCRTFNSWRSGSTKMAVQTERRILECVPLFLDKSKQFQLLSFQIPSIIQQQQHECEITLARSSGLEGLYCSVAKTVLEKTFKLDWFVREVFLEAELTEFLNVIKYTMIDVLRRSYARVREDLATIDGFRPEMDGTLLVSYHISVLDCQLDIDAYPSSGGFQLPVSLPTARLVTEFGEQYRTFLLDHALAQYKVDAGGDASREIALSDLRTVADQLERTQSDQEYDAKIEVQGQGGTIRIHFQKKNIIRLRYAIVLEAIKIISTISVSVTIVIWACLKGFWPILVGCPKVTITIEKTSSLYAL